MAMVVTSMSHGSAQRGVRMVPIEEMSSNGLLEPSWQPRMISHDAKPSAVYAISPNDIKTVQMISPRQQLGYEDWLKA